MDGSWATGEVLAPPGALGGRAPLPGGWGEAPGSDSGARLGGESQALWQPLLLSLEDRGQGGEGSREPSGSASPPQPLSVHPGRFSASVRVSETLSVPRPSRVSHTGCSGPWHWSSSLSSHAQGHMRPTGPGMLPPLALVNCPKSPCLDWTSQWSRRRARGQSSRPQPLSCGPRPLAVGKPPSPCKDTGAACGPSG